MSRAKWCEDRRMQKFRDVLGRWEAGSLSQLEAGELLGWGVLLGAAALGVY